MPPLITDATAEVRIRKVPLRVRRQWASLAVSLGVTQAQLLEAACKLIEETTQ